MIAFKRNQVEEAISRVMEPGATRPGSALRTQLKRLMDADRNTELNAYETNPQFAFYSGKPPGRGKEVWFSEYEAFALSVALALMVHNWPQGFAVGIMRSARQKLEKEHARTLKLDREWLFSQEASPERSDGGKYVFGNQDPLLLTIVSNRGLIKKENENPYACDVCRGFEEASAFAKQFQLITGGAFSLFDVVPLAHQVSKALAETRPRSRGRS